MEESDHCQDRQSSCTCTRLISIVVSLFKAFAQKSSCLWVVDVFSTKTPSDIFQHHYQHGVWRGLKRSPTFWPLSWRIFDNAMYIWRQNVTVRSVSLETSYNVQTGSWRFPQNCNMRSSFAVHFLPSPWNWQRYQLGVDYFCIHVVLHTHTVYIYV